jgi:hypothetical protein
MNRDRLTIPTVCIAGAALLWCWYLLSREPEPVQPRAYSLPERTTRWPATTPAATAAWPARGTPELRARLREPAARWLDARGRDAAGLLAIWDLCRDADLLYEAASRFPNDPRVCRAMVESCTGQPDRALFWIEKLIALEPRNPEGNYLKAWALFASEDTDGALAVLRTDTTIALARDSQLRTRAVNLREAATALGLPGRAVALASIDFIRDHDLARRFYDRSGPALTALMDQARFAGDAAAVVSLGHTALAASLNQGIGFDSPTVITDETAANRFLRSIINRLPDDWTWQPGSLTAAEWKQHAMHECVDLAHANALARRAAICVASASNEVVIEYSRKFLREGEITANSWLLARAESAQR